MRTATLSVVFAVMAIGAPQREPAKALSEAQNQQKSADLPLAVLCAPVGAIQLGVAYNSTVLASGGTGAYQFAVTGGSLPPGIALNPATGTIAGTPTADGSFSFMVQVTDSAGATATTGTTPCTLQPPVASAPAPMAATVASTDAPKPHAVAPRESDPATLAQPRVEAGTKTPQTAPDEHPFTLGAEDQISILVYGSPEFNGSHLIRPDGKITMPFLGDILASGLTPVDLGGLIKERLRKYIVDPDVSVSVTAVNSKRFYIQGEVNKPGQYTLLVPTKVLEALVNAGGFKDFANQKKIVVMRVTGERLNFNYKEVIRGKKMEQNIYLKPGDIIIVK
jgi:polysaccharide export outer membrane protein